MNILYISLKTFTECCDFFKMSNLTDLQAAEIDTFIVLGLGLGICLGVKKHKTK